MDSALVRLAGLGAMLPFTGRRRKGGFQTGTGHSERRQAAAGNGKVGRFQTVAFGAPSPGNRPFIRHDFRPDGANSSVTHRCQQMPWFVRQVNPICRTKASRQDRVQLRWQAIMRVVGELRSYSNKVHRFMSNWERRAQRAADLFVPRWFHYWT